MSHTLSFLLSYSLRLQLFLYRPQCFSPPQSLHQARSSLRCVQLHAVSRYSVIFTPLSRSFVEVVFLVVFSSSFVAPGRFYSSSCLPLLHDTSAYRVGRKSHFLYVLV